MHKMQEEGNANEFDLVTLSRHVLHNQALHPEASGDLTLLLVSIQVACKYISSKVRRAGLVNLTGLAGDVNVQGEEVKKLDVVANEIFIRCLETSGKVCRMVSEENKEIIEVKSDSGKYCVVFDPLDGSSNIDSGVSIGTIFGVYNCCHDSHSAFSSSDGEVLRPGREMIAAGYAMYGSFTIFVLATSEGVNGYTLDPMKLPKKGKIYSVNEGNVRYWDQQTKEYFENIKNPKDNSQSPYSLRYVGSMVADVHRTLIHGGIFAYPADSKSPKGKLRLLYECFPMAFITEMAGGMAIDGKGERILNLQPDAIHARSSIILGSLDDVNQYKIKVNGNNQK